LEEKLLLEGEVRQRNLHGTIAADVCALLNEFGDELLHLLLTVFQQGKKALLVLLQNALHVANHLDDVNLVEVKQGVLHLWHEPGALLGRRGRGRRG
jgi:hypothetical protein